MHFSTWYTFSPQKWTTALCSSLVQMKLECPCLWHKTHDRNGLSMSHLHYNVRRAVDHVYLVMPNQQYSQLQNMYLHLQIIFDSPTYIKICYKHTVCANMHACLSNDIKTVTQRCFIKHIPVSFCSSGKMCSVAKEVKSTSWFVWVVPWRCVWPLLASEVTKYSTVSLSLQFSHGFSMYFWSIA
jgi:hypothetical protein